MDCSSLSSNNFLPNVQRCIKAFNGLSRMNVGDYLSERQGQLVVKNDYQENKLGAVRYAGSLVFKPWYYYGLLAEALEKIKIDLDKSAHDLLRHSVKVISKEDFEEFKALVEQLQTSMKKAHERLEEIQTKERGSSFFGFYELAIDQFKAYVNEQDQTLEALITKENTLRESALNSSQLGQSILSNNSLSTSQMPDVQPATNLPQPNSLPSSKPENKMEVKEKSSQPAVETPVKKPIFNVEAYCHPIFASNGQADKPAEQMAIKFYTDGKKAAQIQEVKTQYDEAREKLIAKIRTLTPKDLKAWQKEHAEALCLEIGVCPLTSMSPSVVPTGNLPLSGQRGAPPPPSQRGGPPPPPSQRGGPPPPGQRGAAGRGGHLAAKLEKPLTEQDLSVALRDEFMKLEGNFAAAYAELIKLLVDKDTCIERKLTKKDLEILILNTESHIAEFTASSKSLPTKKNEQAAEKLDLQKAQKLNTFLSEIEDAKAAITKLDRLKLRLDEAQKARNAVVHADEKTYNSATEELAKVENECKSLLAKHMKSSLEVVKDEHFILAKLERLQLLSKHINAPVEAHVFASCQASCESIKQKRLEASNEKASTKAEINDLIKVLNKKLNQIASKIFEQAESSAKGLKNGSLELEDFLPAVKAPNFKRSESAPVKLRPEPSEPKQNERPVKITARPSAEPKPATVEQQAPQELPTPQRSYRPQPQCPLPPPKDKS